MKSSTLRRSNLSKERIAVLEQLAEARRKPTSAVEEYTRQEPTSNKEKELMEYWELMKDPEMQSDMVDLGLSVKWARCNLGASTPWSPGDIYTWGDTLLCKEEKSSFDHWADYKWCNGINPRKRDGVLTKYNTRSSYGKVDNKTVLDLCDDVAHVKLGGKWRMPTIEEWEELKKNCNWTYTSSGNFIVTSKIPGYTNKSIYLPLKQTDNPDAKVAYYWSSSLDARRPYKAYAFDCSWWWHSICNVRRCAALYVRPVSE